MQRSGTEAIKTQLQSSKPKRDITNITNSKNTKITYGQPSEQLFPKRWPLSIRNRTKNNMNARKLTGYSRQCSGRLLHTDGNDLYCDICRKLRSDNVTIYRALLVAFQLV